MTTANKVWLTIGALVLVGAVMQQFEDDPVTRTPAPQRTQVTTAANVVTYNVTGTAHRASLTLENDTGGTDQFTVNVPWREQYSRFTRNDFVYVSAQNEGTSGTLICEIRVNGILEYSGSATGQYAICTASGIVP